MTWDGLDVAILSPTPIYPVDHGNRKRIDSICKRLRHYGAKVHFLHYPAEHDWRQRVPDGVENEMRQKVDSYYLIPPSRDLHPYSIGMDHAIDEWWDTSIATFLTWFFAHVRAQVFIVEYTWLSKAFEYAPSNCATVLDTHDKFADRRLLLASLGLGPEFFHTTVEEESKAASRADIVWAIKEQEEAYFRDICNAHVRTLVHWETADQVPAKPHDGYLRAGIIGARNSINNSNITRFLDAALHKIRSYMAPIKIVIAGGCCDDLEHIQHPNVELLGRVPSVRQFYESIDIALVPMDRSTGLKIKVAEALCQGVPLVAHEHAFEGFPPRHPDHQCNSFEDITTRLIQYSFAPEDLASLRSSTIEAANALGVLFDRTIVETGRLIREMRGGIALLLSPSQANSPLIKAILADNGQYLSYLGIPQIYVIGSDFDAEINAVYHPSCNLTLSMQHLHAESDCAFPDGLKERLARDCIKAVFDYRFTSATPNLEDLPDGTRYWKRYYSQNVDGAADSSRSNMGHAGIATFNSIEAFPVTQSLERHDAIPYFYSNDVLKGLKLDSKLRENLVAIVYDDSTEALALAAQGLWSDLKENRECILHKISNGGYEFIEFADRLIQSESIPRRCLFLTTVPAEQTAAGEFLLRLGTDIFNAADFGERTPTSKRLILLSNLIDLFLGDDNHPIRERPAIRRDSFQRAIANDAGWTRVWNALRERRHDDPYSNLYSYFGN